MPAFSLGSVSAFAVTTSGDQTIQGSKTFQAPAANKIPLVVQGLTSQSVNFTQWVDSTGAIRATVRQDGSIAVNDAGTYFRMSGLINGAVLSCRPNAPAEGGLLVRATASQTSNLIEVQNSAGTRLASVSPTGIVEGIDTAWHVVGAAGEPGFLNGWVNYGGEWETAGFRKDANGYVHIKGLVKAGTINAAVFTLPPGYRPAAGVHLMSFSGAAPGGIRIIGANNTAGAAGNVILGDPGTNGWFSINVSFLAEG